MNEWMNYMIGFIIIPSVSFQVFLQINFVGTRIYIKVLWKWIGKFRRLKINSIITTYMCWWLKMTLQNGIEKKRLRELCVLAGTINLWGKELNEYFWMKELMLRKRQVKLSLIPIKYFGMRCGKNSEMNFFLRLCLLLVPFEDD